MSNERTQVMHVPSDDAGKHLRIPDFELLRELERGGFGEVWLARSTTGVHRAIKLLRKSEITDTEFAGVRTYETHVRNHPHLIDIRHVGEAGEYWYYVMELADGCPTAPTFSQADYLPRTLGAELRRVGHLPLADAAAITRAMLSGLEHLHRHDLLHRDVKPSNILFVDGVPKLADIGLVAERGREQPSACTPLYAPPEGVVARSGDLYCLGRVLHQMASGIPADRYPDFPADADARRRAAIRQILPVIDRACAPNPQDRFQSAEQFSVALDNAVGPPAPILARERGAKRPAWSRRAAIGTVFSAALATVALFIAFWPGGSAPRSGTLDVLYKEYADAPVHYRVEPDSLPLRTGELIKVQATLDSPGYPVLATISEAYGVQIAYPLPEQLGSQPRVCELTVPQRDAADQDHWWRLSPPDGTLTFVLLGGVAPLRNAQDSERVRTRLASLANLPIVDADTMISLVNGQPQRSRGRLERSRGITNVRQTVVSDDGMLTQLRDAFPDFTLVEAIAVPQVTPTPASTGPGALP